MHFPQRNLLGPVLADLWIVELYPPALISLEATGGLNQNSTHYPTAPYHTPP